MRLEAKILRKLAWIVMVLCTGLTRTFALEVIVDNAGLGVQNPAGGRTFTGTWCVSAAANGCGGKTTPTIPRWI